MNLVYFRYIFYLYINFSLCNLYSSFIFFLISVIVFFHLWYIFIRIILCSDCVYDNCYFINELSENV